MKHQDDAESYARGDPRLKGEKKLNSLQEEYDRINLIPNLKERLQAARELQEFLNG